jgi:hypothetical protein
MFNGHLEFTIIIDACFGEKDIIPTWERQLLSSIFLLKTVGVKIYVLKNKFKNNSQRSLS